MISRDKVVRHLGFEFWAPRPTLAPYWNGAAVLLLCAASGIPAASAMLAPRALAQPAAQTSAPAAHPVGTVKAISGSTITLSTDAGQSYTVTVEDGARILQIAPGSTDLKSAQVIALTDIAVGDRILVTGRAGRFAQRPDCVARHSDEVDRHRAKARGRGGRLAEARLRRHRQRRRPRHRHRYHHRARQEGGDPDHLRNHLPPLRERFGEV